MNLSTFSYFCFLGFIASSFFSPSIRAVFLIAGLILWLVSSKFEVRGSKEEGVSPQASNFKLQTLSYFLIAYILVNLVLDLIHGVGIFPWLKSLVSTYAQWFWGLSLLQSKLSQEPRARSLEFTIIGSASLLSLLIILQLIGILPSDHGFYGVLSQPFTSSGLLLISFFVTLRGLEVGSQKPEASLNEPRTSSFGPLTFGCSLMIQMVAIFTLGQRSVWLGFLIGLVIYLIATKQYQNKFVWISTLVLVLAGSFIVTKSPRVEHRIQRFVNPSSWLQSKTFTMRKELWKLNYQAWKNRPITGIHDVIEVEGLKHVHNIYLQQLFTGGVAKFITWLAFYLFAAWSLFSLSRGVAKRGDLLAGNAILSLFAAFVALSLEGLLENWWGDSEVLTLFFVVLILAQAFVWQKPADTMN